MVAQADGRPQSRQQRGRGHVDRVEILRGDAHRLAVIFPQMRNEGAHLIDHRDARSDRQPDQHATQREDAGRGQHDDRDRPEAGSGFDAVPQQLRLAFRRAAAEGRVDRQRRIAFDDRRAQLGRQQRDRRQDRIADQQTDRRERGNDDEGGQRPRLHQRERQIFGILRRAVARLGMVQVMHAFVHEAGGEHRHADQRVPAATEARQRAVLHVADFVNEAERAVQRQRRHHRGQHDPSGSLHRHRDRQRAIADHRRGDQIGPVDAGARRDEVARQFGSGAQHRLVVGDPRARGPRGGCRRSGAAREGQRAFHGVVHCP